MELISLIVGISIGASLLWGVICLLAGGPDGKRRALACMALVVILGVAYGWLGR